MRKRISRTALVAVALAGCLGLAVPGAAAAVPPAATTPGEQPPAAASSSPADPNAAAAGGDSVDPAAARALATERGIPVAEATRRLALQRSVGLLGSRIEKSLGSATGGSYLDADGRLVVTTLTAAADLAATRAGARAQRVLRSAASLQKIVDRLDAGAAAGGAGSVQGWYVDIPSNSVVVTLTTGATDPRARSLTALAKMFGSSVRFEHRSAAEQPRLAEYMVGGYQIVVVGGGTCSVGFNTVDASNRNVVLTAGHCTRPSGVISRNGYQIGATRSSIFPEDDFGTFWNSYPGYWQPTASVYQYNNTYMTVHGSWSAPVGATVCKSGRTTFWTCGVIRGLNETVNYSGSVVRGLVRHTACVEGGDSGGSNVSTGGYALGMTSGADMTTSGQCRSKIGQENVSWYQPIGEALTRSGLRLLVA